MYQLFQLFLLRWFQVRKFLVKVFKISELSSLDGPGSDLSIKSEFTSGSNTFDSYGTVFTTVIGFEIELSLSKYSFNIFT